MIFSVYMQMKVGNTTHIKFGGYDKEGIAPTQKLTFLKTIDNSTWQLEIENSMIMDDFILGAGSP